MGIFTCLPFANLQKVWGVTVIPSQDALLLYDQSKGGPCSVWNTNSACTTAEHGCCRAFLFLISYASIYSAFEKGKPCTLLCTWGEINQIEFRHVAIDNRYKIQFAFSFSLASPTFGTNVEAKYSGNSIEDVPSSICNLVCLKSLSLNGNKIRQVLCTAYLLFSYNKITRACDPT